MYVFSEATDLKARTASLVSMHPEASSPFCKKRLKLSAIGRHLFPHRRACIVFALLSLELLLLLVRDSSVLRFSAPLDAACAFGTVFVYDLPEAFNKDLVNNCDELTPWHSLCDGVSNGGFGRTAASSLESVVPDEFLSSWYATDQFAAELIFHDRMLSHRCRTLDPSSASAFYVPFYAGLAVGKHLWAANSTAAARDRDCTRVLDWVREQEPWRRSGGQDHFIALGRITWDFRRSGDDGWGSSFLRMPGMRHVTRLMIERSPWDRRDVGVPYPTGFHPRAPAEVRAWQRFVLARARPTLFSFAGSRRPGFEDDFRALLLDECARSGSCSTVDCGGNALCGGGGNGSVGAVGLFLGSVFCLQPRGDSFTRRSLFDCMVAGAVPVLFWRRSAYEQYGWYLPAGSAEEEGEWSVFIDSRRVRRGAVSVRAVLEGIGEERARRMRERVVGLIPRILYAGAREGFGEGMEDAFDVALNGVLRRFRDGRSERDRRQ